MKRVYLLVLFLTYFFCSCGQKNRSNNTSTLSDTVDIRSTIKIVADSEPGEPMIISGTIYLPDGRTPAKGAILSVWHTDAKGYYIEGGGGAGELHPRIHGRMKTRADGKYEFRTIKPAPYPSNNTPAHIHVHISGTGFPEYSPDNYVLKETN
ncbi:hypothetical protein BH10BAC4_BH10BAC4_04740 [soil metagenome]